MHPGGRETLHWKQMSEDLRKGDREKYTFRLAFRRFERFVQTPCQSSKIEHFAKIVNSFILNTRSWNQ